MNEHGEHCPSTEATARRLGCLCDWWGRGSIARFHEDCEVPHFNRPPHSDVERQTCQAPFTSALTMVPLATAIVRTH